MDLDSWVSPLLALNAETLLQTKLARAGGMMLLVVVIISLIGLLYGSNNQKIGKVHFALRPHQPSREKFDGLVAQKNDEYLPVQSDGMSATVRFYYGWHDRKGRFRKAPLAQRQLRLLVQAGALPNVVARIHGCEPVEGVRTEDVYIPPYDDLASGESVGATPDLLTDYYAQNNVIEKWPHDNTAKLISVRADLHELLRQKRDELIQDRAAALRMARSGNWWRRRNVKRLSETRISPLGGYYLDLRFHWDPWFVLFRHPDRDLKMTAWLTVLTSIFSLAMDLWPVKDTEAKAAVAAEQTETGRPVVRGQQ
jgi:hypothetical protein